MRPDDVQPTPLPHAHVLSYITHTGTPTRVRLIAARVTMIVGILNCIIALWLLSAVGFDVYVHAIGRTATTVFVGPPLGVVVGSRPLELNDFLIATKDEFRAEPHWILPLPLLIVGAALLPLLAPGIKRGRRTPSLLAMFYFATTIVPVGLISILILSFVTSHTYNGRPGPPHPWAFAWLLLIPVAALPPILLKDTCAFLLWIIRHPVAEKPLVPFLPGTAAASTAEVHP